MAIDAFTFIVNKHTHRCEVDKDKPLLWVLRENLGLTGTKFGCGIAACGACTVLIEERGLEGTKPEDTKFNEPRARYPVRSCVVRAEEVQNRHVTTIEGLSGDGELVQQAWLEADVPQCGYCQSGQIMTTVALLESFKQSGRELHDDDINAALAGNLCRCGTYVRIRAAVKTAWAAIKQPSGSRS
jgi:isoquinoline 1-oxidoreductase subunit alpha